MRNWPNNRKLTRLGPSANVEVNVSRGNWRSAHFVLRLSILQITLKAAEKRTKGYLSLTVPIDFNFGRTCTSFGAADLIALVMSTIGGGSFHSGLRPT